MLIYIMVKIKDMLNIIYDILNGFWLFNISFMMY
jgi:hypothetical protein